MGASAADSTAPKAILMLPGKVRLDGRVCKDAQGTLLFRPYEPVSPPPPLNDPVTFYCEGVNKSGGKPQAMQASITALEAQGLALSLDSQTPPDTLRSLNKLLTPQTAQRPRAPGEGAALAAGLDSFRDQALQGLDEQLQVMMIALVEHMLDLSASSKTSSSGHNLHYEAMNAFKRGHRDIINRVLDQVRDQFDDLTPAEQARRGADRAAADLDLVDLNEFEDYLAIDRMVTLGEDLHHVALEALTLRLAAMQGEDPMRVRLPVHVATLCRAFHRALDGNRIPHEVVPDIFDFFQRRFVRELGDYYGPLNESLAAAGVEPGIENEIIARGSLLQRPKAIRKPPKPEAPSAPEHAPVPPGRREEAVSHSEAPDLGTPPPKPSPSPAAPDAGDAPLSRRDMVEEVVEGVVEKISQRLKPDDLYRSVIDALNFKREFEGLAVAPGGTGTAAAVGEAPANLADAATIANALGRLQHDAAVRTAIHQGQSPREYLAAHASAIAGNVAQPIM